MKSLVAEKLPRKHLKELVEALEPTTTVTPEAPQKCLPKPLVSEREHQSLETLLLSTPKESPRLLTEL